MLVCFWWVCVCSYSVIYLGFVCESLECVVCLYCEFGDECGEYLVFVELVFNWCVDCVEVCVMLVVVCRLENFGWLVVVLECGLMIEVVLYLILGWYDVVRCCYWVVLEVCECGGFDVGVICVCLNFVD